MNLLKKGDKIRMTRNFGALPVGDILTIQAVDKKDESMPYLAGGYWLSANCFEPVSEFHAGQIYMLIDKDSGDIVGIAKFLGCANDHKSMQWRTIRTDAGQTFVRHTSYQLLTGKEIGKAIRKWDAGHAKKPKPEYNEVKRPAKTGEYIKVVSARGAEGYKNGDVLLVTNRLIEGAVICKNIPVCICNDEYVVLEPKTGVKEVWRPAKVGKYVKSSGKRSYTVEQIKQAKELLGQMMVEALGDKATGVMFVRKKKNITCLLNADDIDDISSGKATCNKQDEFNTWIGRCVSICKALHKPIPAFITEG